MKQQGSIFPLRVQKIVDETEDTRSFVLETIHGESLPFIPGQFLTFVFENALGEQRRNYSLSSLPGEPLRITVKRIPNGEYSRFLNDRVVEGDQLYTIGASGFFTLPANEVYEQYVFFAAGSGITPIFTLIRQLLAEQPGAKILLVYSNRTLSNAIFYTELQELQQQYRDRFQIEFLFSDAAHLERKRLGIYVLERILSAHVASDHTRQLFYLCGPFEYMRLITIVLRNNGVPADQIRKETFTILIPDKKPTPPDRDAHQVEVMLSNKSYQFETQHPHTILQTAKILQLPLPYSCEAGQCGTCAATCVSGKVWMWRNDVLLDEEIEKGRILTCTGYPVGGDVKLVF